MRRPIHFKKILDIFTTIVVILVVIFAILLVGVRIFGLRTYAVISGSMEPKYPVGCLIYVKSVDPSEVGTDDVITFVLANGTVATHRVFDVDTENQLFYTRGDANFKINPTTGEKEYTEDPPVHFKNLIGKPVFKIPILGYIAWFIQNPPGSYISISIGALLLMIVFVPDFFKDKKKEESKSKQAEDLPQT